MNHVFSSLPLTKIQIKRNENDPCNTRNVQIEVSMHYFVYIYWISFTVDESYVYVYKVRGTICRTKTKYHVMYNFEFD